MYIFVIFVILQMSGALNLDDAADMFGGINSYTQGDGVGGGSAASDDGSSASFAMGGAEQGEEEDFTVLMRHWKNEVASVGLLPIDADLVEGLTLLLKNQLSVIEQLSESVADPMSALQLSMYHSEIDRVKYVLVDYLRTRLRKIEKNAIFYLSNYPDGFEYRSNPSAGIDPDDNNLGADRFVLVSLRRQHVAATLPLACLVVSCRFLHFFARSRSASVSISLSHTRTHIQTNKKKRIQFMTAKELKFCSSYAALFRKHMNSTVLKHMPATVIEDKPELDLSLQKLDDVRNANMVEPPIETDYILGRMTSNGADWPRQGNNDEHDFSDYRRGHMILARYSAVKERVSSGDVVLIP